MPENYTHTYQFKVGDEDIQGKIKFPLVKGYLMSINGNVKSLEMIQAQAFSECLQHLGKLFKAFGSIESIEIKEITP